MVPRIRRCSHAGEEGFLAALGMTEPLGMTPWIGAAPMQGEERFLAALGMTERLGVTERISPLQIRKLLGAAWGWCFACGGKQQRVEAVFAGQLVEGGEVFA